MPARDIKDELQGNSLEGNPTQPPAGGGVMSAFASPQSTSIQITTDPTLQETLVEIVLDDFHKAKGDRDRRDYGITSRGETLRFTEWFKAIKDLYNGNKIPKNIPWKFCSNRSLRIATSILDLIHSRIFPAVWNEDLTRWRPGNIVDVPRVERITKFMSWWIRVHNSLRPFFDLWTKYTAGIGDSLTETSWDIEEVVSAQTIEQPVVDEMGQPLNNQDGTPAITKQPKINKIEKTKSVVIPKENVFTMENFRDVQRDPVLIEETYLFRQLEDMEKRGLALNVTSTLEKLMHVPDLSGSLDPKKKETLRRVKLRNMPVKILREYLHYDVDGVGVNESTRIMIAPEQRVYLSGVRMRDVTKSGRRPLKHTKYDHYLDRPYDYDGEGVLTKVKELAEEVDACFNQLTDANTLGVLRPFFYDPSGDVDAAAINLGPNKGIPVTDPSRNVYFPPIEIPTERLINAIRLVMEFIERLTAASEYVMGRESDVVGGSGTATRTQAIVQSAQIRFTLPAERLRHGASGILNDHLDILQLNIQPGMEEKVLGEKGEALFHAGELSDEGLTGEYTAYLLPDPSMGSKETERNLWNLMYSILMQNPIVMSDPVKIYNVTAKLMKVNDQEPEPYLGPAPQMDDIDDPQDENTLMIQGEFQRVTPQITENHLYHIQKHTDLLKSPNFIALQSKAPELAMQVAEYAQQHIQEHMKMMQMAMTMAGKNQGAMGGNEQKSGGQDGGNDGGAGEKSKGNAGQPGMENVPGPLGQALATQRKGESGKPPGS